MPATVVLAVYGSSAILALALLYFLRCRHWYWHVAALLVSLGIGLFPLPEAWHTPPRELTIGGLFLFLFLWGAGAPFFPRHHAHAHHHAPPQKA